MVKLRSWLAVALLGLSSATALAQSSMAPTNPFPQVIAVVNTFQLLFATGVSKRSLTIANNNATANCFILIGGPWAAGDTSATSRAVNGQTVTTLQGAIKLTPGVIYRRDYPLAPSDQILVTCDAAGSVYADIQ